MNWYGLSALLLLGLTPAAVAEQEIYRSTLPDDTIVYGESPFPGAKRVRKVIAPSGAAGITVVTPAEKAHGAASTGASKPAVSVIPTPPRPPTPAATAGSSSPRDAMPKRDY